MSRLFRSRRDKPGYYHGKHYSEYVDEVKSLKRKGESAKLEGLLQALVDAAESEAEAQNWGVAPWYYEELAKLYRKQKLYNAEVAILERFSRQRHGPGETPAKLLERLAKARSLAEKQ